jgi:hypothetical protein
MMTALGLLNLSFDFVDLVLQALGLIMSAVASELLHFLVQLAHALVQLFPGRRSVMLRTIVMRTLHFIGLAEHVFCFALELFRFRSQIVGIGLVRNAKVRDEHKNRAGGNQCCQESSHFESPETVDRGEST